MYLWKAWHDSRARVVIYILAALSLGVLSGLAVMTQANYHAFLMAYVAYHRPAGVPLPVFNHYFNSDFYMDITFSALRYFMDYGRPLDLTTFVVYDWAFLVGYGLTPVLLASLSLGAVSVGREYAAGTMNFVLTRPGPRRNFVLTDWMVGLTAMVLIVSGLVFPVFPFLYAIHAKGPGNVLANLPALWVLGAAVYGLSHFTTTVAGSPAKGLILSVATVLTFSLLPTALHDWWHTDALLRATDWTLRIFHYGSWPLGPFDWSVTAFWLAVAAGFLGASLAWIRWREV
jgi:ABC-type transport system involved in multi-copper enzyme maturation permease subunit